MGEKCIGALLAFAYVTGVHAQTSGPATVAACSEATRARSGVGVRYTGVVQNDDYRFSVKIPNGLTGWGGIAPDAPFHGFLIPLDSVTDGCIVFEIHLRVDEVAATKNMAGGKTLTLGTARAWQTQEEGVVRGVAITNIRTVFSSVNPNRVDDGEILLITPASQIERAAKLYKAFLRSLRFSG
jgi:hypothetical protein